EGEEILVHEKDLLPQIKSTWGHFGGEHIVEPSKGDIYLTNQRLIFVKNIEGVIQRIGATSATTIAPQTYAMPMESIGLKNIDTKKGVRDFFEIPIKEILACEIHGGLVSGGSQIYAYLLSKGEQYHLTIIVKEDSGLLIRFMQNAVENIEELTNNLKLYFENSDWIYIKEKEGEESTGE
ncbi:MAG: hypothetical protein KAJ51_17655, partial [Thermoplasmata archaeon]|nr:hypothetical protein [Thermoplasmata archaeon]